MLSPKKNHIHSTVPACVFMTRKPHCQVCEKSVF